MENLLQGCPIIWRKMIAFYPMWDKFEWRYLFKSESKGIRRRIKRSGITVANRIFLVLLFLSLSHFWAEKLPVVANGNFLEWKIKAIELLSRRAKHFLPSSIELALTRLERSRGQRGKGEQKNFLSAFVCSSRYSTFALIHCSRGFSNREL